MVDNSIISSVHNKLFNDYLRSVGIDNELIKEILSYQLLVEKVGERENNDWWKSNLFTKFGRSSLKEVLPKSWTKARIKLARKTGQKVENEIIGEKEFISLFHLGPYFDHLLERKLNNIDSENSFLELENLDIKLNERGWTKSLVDKNIEFNEIKNAKICLGEITPKEIEDDNNILYFARNLLYSYGESIENNLIVPYYVIKNE